MLPGLLEMRAVALLLQQRQQRLQRRPDVAHHGEIDGGAAADLLRAEIDLRDADPGSPGIELPIGEVRPEHQQDITVEHGIVTGRNPISPVMPTS